MVANGGAVIAPICGNASLAYWSILLIHQNFIRFGAPKSRLAARGSPAGDDARLTAGALNRMCVQPGLVLEKRSKQQRYMPMVISFGARRE
jgi:hypothetical protein